MDGVCFVSGKEAAGSVVLLPPRGHEWGTALGAWRGRAPCVWGEGAPKSGVALLCNNGGGCSGWEGAAPEKHRELEGGGWGWGGHGASMWSAKDLWGQRHFRGCLYFGLLQG